MHVSCIEQRASGTDPDGGCGVAVDGESGYHESSRGGVERESHSVSGLRSPPQDGTARHTQRSAQLFRFSPLRETSHTGHRQQVSS